MQKNTHRVRIVAEIGTGHGGNLAKARELVDAALDSGADMAKFQLVYADEILHPDTGMVHLPGGAVRLYDRFRELEVRPEFFVEIAAYCDKKGIDFLCSPFGLRSARELKELNPSWMKIASPELNHFPLIREMAGYGIPLILSSGVSRLADIEKALEAASPAPDRILLHCVTSYPAPEGEYNLNVLKNLSSLFGVKVGVSDHSLDPVLVPVLAVATGACMIEKHITLSRSGDGLDDPVALPPDLFTKMANAVREAEGKDGETVIAETSERYGKERILEVFGTGKKELAPAERANYGRTNRSLHYLRNMKKGERIGADDVAILRTEKILTPGISPEFIDTVTGAILVQDVTNGAGVTWDDFMARG
jgi:sialic acid synthase SpsE